MVPNTAKKSSQPPNITLSISFNGPLFFDFGSHRDQVDIYAPYCPYHEAAFFFQRRSFSETDLYACAVKKAQEAPPPHKHPKRHYTIEGGGITKNTSLPQPTQVIFPDPVKLVTHNPGNPVPPKEKRAATASIYLLSIDHAISKGSPRGAQSGPRLKKALLKLSVPMPAYVSSLYTDHLEVVPDSSAPGSSSTSASLEHCTALRFFYEWDAASKIVLRAPLQQDKDITPPIYDKLPKMADIEFRYSGIDLEDANDPHADARSCFASLTALANTSWSLNYGDGRTTPSSPGEPVGHPVPPDPCGDELKGSGTITMRTGADCHAPSITTGLTLADL